VIIKIHRSYFRQAFWFKIKAAVQFKPEEYYSILRIARGLHCVLECAANAEIGPKGLPEITPIGCPDHSDPRNPGIPS